MREMGVALKEGNIFLFVGDYSSFYSFFEEK